MERQAPRQILYENQLPLAIESKSQRRLFFPEGGSTYGPPGGANPNIIRIPINADSMLDVQHSYLTFNLNATAGVAKGLAPDIGVPFIRRLRIESAGTTLEDIDEYGKLYGNVLFPAQASNGAIQEATITTKGIGSTGGQLRQVGGGALAVGNIADGAVVLDGNAVINAAAIGDTSGGDVSAAIATAIRQGVKNAINTSKDSVLAQANGAVITAAGPGNPKHSLTNTMVGGTTYKYSVNLVSALLNMEKYLPLVMMNAGLTLELELDVAGSAGLQDANGAAGAGAGDEAPEWTISDVRYVAHLIDLQRDFYDKTRMVMESSGGVLQLAGSTFRHYQGAISGAAGSETINLPARVKSVQSVFFTLTPSGAKTDVRFFGISNSLPMGLSEYQFRIGSITYPSAKVQLTQGPGNTYVNKGEAYSELRKAFGTLGNYMEGGFLNNDGYLPLSNTENCAGGGTADAPAVPLQSPFGLDFQSFPKTALESGVNTADRSLNMSLELTRTGGFDQLGVADVWVMSDAIFYVNMDGSVSVSV